MRAGALPAHATIGVRGRRHHAAGKAINTKKRSETPASPAAANRSRHAARRTGAHPARAVDNRPLAPADATHRTLFYIV
ncbi:hypothetical protein TP37_08430 [Xanthomonas citri pv. aurantifolii]|nr:hypothetical protein TP37_08430 [Xanthomonas citri pv. aurantifolii]AMV03018.1 hypothetical protein TP50_11585 [Xanthomonas citri pv. aurantifolii]TBW95003.1 hypothetical protein TP49_17405 [Xanthomonas citri pv. aurantifolii]